MNLIRSAQVGIIGAGPAGVAASVQLKRYGIPFILFEKEIVGGLLRNANLVENYLGFPKGVKGTEMVQLLFRQLAKWKIQAIHAEVKQAKWEADGWKIFTADKKYRFHRLIVATGTKPSPIDLPFADTDASKLVFSEVFPLLEWRKRKISIIGGGDAAFDYALSLSRNNEITIHNRSDKFNCLPLLWDRAAKSSKIKIIQNSEIVSIQTSQSGLALQWNEEGAKHEELADCMICAVGRDPDLSCIETSTLEQLEELIPQGRIYFIGDVKNGLCRQSSIASGDGIRAAMEIAHQMKAVKS